MKLQDALTKSITMLWLFTISVMAYGSNSEYIAGKKNILFIVMDDLNTYLLGNPGRYDGPVIAPNMTSLADSGVNFRQAYAASPKCQPSRAAFLTGVAPWTSGLYDNGRDKTNAIKLWDVPSIGEYFQNNGYYVCSFGKIQHGYDPQKLKDGKSPSGFSYDEYEGNSSDPEPKGAPFSEWGRQKLKEDGKYPSEDWGATDIEEEEIHDTKMANEAIRIIQKDHNKPFFLLLGIFHPHQPFYAPQRFIDKYDDYLPLPPMMKNPEDDLDDIPSAGKKLIHSQFFPNVVKENLHHRVVQCYLAATSYADDQVGRVLEALENSKYKDNTIVVLISDNGFHLGEKTHITKGTIWECGSNTLMMWRVPGLTAPNQVCETPVSLLDIYPTLCDLTGLEKPDHLDGNTLIPLLEDVMKEWSIPALSSQSGHMMVRWKNYRYIRYHSEEGGGEELYDREKDPKEWNNLAGDVEYKEIKAELKHLMPSENEMAPQLPKGD